VVDPQGSQQAMQAVLDTADFAVDGLRQGMSTVGAVVGAGLSAASKSINLDELAESGKEIDLADKRGEYTRAGRALQKHGSREGSVFPSASGSKQLANQEGQDQLEDILTHPEGTVTELGRGGVQVSVPDGRGARWSADGTFDGFVENPATSAPTE
ncbi:MAG: hypothetical protein ABMB14_40165, partial [Myxococcota bacterium]